MTSVVIAAPGTRARMSSTSAAKRAAVYGPPHAPQRAVVAALEREMDVAAQARVLEPIEHRRVELPGRDRGEAQATGRGRRQHRVEQVGQPGGAVAIGRDLNAGDDDLGVAGGLERPRLGHHLVERPAALRAARARDDAEGAAHVAAVLHLEQRAGRAEAERNVGDRHAAPAGRRPARVAGEGDSRVDDLQQSILVAVRHHQVDTVERAGGGGLGGGVAAGEHGSSGAAPRARRAAPPCASRAPPGASRCSC